MLCYSMPWEAFFHSVFTTSKSTCLIPASKQGSVSVFTSLGLFYWDTPPSLQIQQALKSTSSFFPKHSSSPTFFSVLLHITPKVILTLFSFSLFFIQSPNLTLSKYLFHLSFSNGVTVVPRPLCNLQVAQCSQTKSKFRALAFVSHKLPVLPLLRDPPTGLRCSQCVPDILKLPAPRCPHV